MADLGAININAVAIELNSSAFDVFISGLDPVIVIFDRFLTEEQFGWRVANCCPDALRILDLEDLHSLRRARQKALKKNQLFIATDLLDEADAKREIASIWRSDLTLVISQFEMQLLAEVFRVDPELLLYIPLFAEKPQEADLPQFEDRRDLIFIGNFRHAPNADAVKQLRELIWPKIHKLLPEVSMRVYGAYPSDGIMQLNNPDLNFFVHGRVEDAADAVRNARIVLAPLRFGAGIKGKLIEAMQCGTPNVTTNIGAEAMAGDFRWPGFIADDADRFAEAAAELYSNPAKWLQAQRSGFDLIANRFAKSGFEPVFLARVSAIRQNLANHRRANFIGSMLQFHGLRSTEFMARWIEEKNKNNQRLLQ